MIKIGTKTYEISHRVVEDILCNKCGESLRVSAFESEETPFTQSSGSLSPLTDDGDATDEESVKRRNLPLAQATGDFFYGLVENTVSGGYHSTALSDGCRYKFSLCERCLATLFDSFLLPVEVTDPTSPWASKAAKEREEKNQVLREEFNQEILRKREARKARAEALQKAEADQAFFEANPAAKRILEGLKALKGDQGEEILLRVEQALTGKE
jgi:hypothetical protein